jgi:hypothetical protein
MEHQKPFDAFSRIAKEKAQAAIDHATEVRIRAADELRERHAEKTACEPHLIADGNHERCSVCGYSFPADVKPSMSVAFADHLREAQHQTG